MGTFIYDTSTPGLTTINADFASTANSASGLSPNASGAVVKTARLTVNPATSISEPIATTMNADDTPIFSYTFAAGEACSVDVKILGKDLTEPGVYRASHTVDYVNHNGTLVELRSPVTYDPKGLGSCSNSAVSSFTEDDQNILKLTVRGLPNHSIQWTAYVTMLSNK